MVVASAALTGLSSEALFRQIGDFRVKTKMRCHASKTMELGSSTGSSIGGALSRTLESVPCRVTGLETKSSHSGSVPAGETGKYIAAPIEATAINPRVMFERSKGAPPNGEVEAPRDHAGRATRAHTVFPRPRSQTNHASRTPPTIVRRQCLHFGYSATNSTSRTTAGVYKRCTWTHVAAGRGVLA
jgi:hypothetical protein